MTQQRQMQLVRRHSQAGSKPDPKAFLLDLTRDRLPVLSFWHHEPLAHPPLPKHTTLPGNVPRLGPALHRVLCSGRASRLLHPQRPAEGGGQGGMQGGKELVAGAPMPRPLAHHTSQHSGP